MNRLTAYLVDFDSRQAVWLFLSVFLMAATGIWFNVLMPWAPAVAVLVYGGFLLYTAKYLLISHSELTNNSPYFLAFILFLTSVLAIFMHSDLSDEREFLQRLGAALLTTIVGIPFRQLLFAYAPAQQEEDRFFRVLEEQLRQSAAQYQRSQTDLVNLISEFVTTRRVLFEDEEKASERYIANLNKGIALFDESFGNYPRTISAAFTKINKSLDRLGEKVAAFDAGTESLSAAEINKFSEQFNEILRSSDGLAIALDALRSSTSGVRESIRALPDDLGAMAARARTESDVLTSDLKRLVTNIQGDITAVDRLLTDFVTILEHRITPPGGKRAGGATNATR